MSKYIDLWRQIAASDDYNSDDRRIIRETLYWLDDHADRVPGRTITRTEYRDTLDHAVKTSGHGDDWERGFCTGLTVSGTKLVPDPEPTNAEKLETEIRELFQEPSQSFSIARDLAEKLDKAGWTKAQGDDDDH